mmetsp:Transcript_2941/g.4288  ORF Transcript_2941/g.4288 Transcript_2941/m.4288 type:complete len:1320 (+) Transcript_2941:163-4122(+)
MKRIIKYILGLTILLIFLTETIYAAVSCFGFSDGNPAVCSSHGTCVAENNCECVAGYGSNDCSLFTCDGIQEGAAGVCNNRGTCSGPNSCTCNVPSDYGGSFCQYPKCNGILSSSSTVCNGRGTCTAPDTCDCLNDYPGNPNGHDGTFCENIYCNSKPAGGPTTCTSVSNGACVFNSDTKLNECQCTANYVSGDNKECEVPLCNAIPATSLSVCNGHGTCTSPNTCSCNSGYGGTYCGTVQCDGVNFDDPSVCNSRGNCTHPNVCSCIEGWRVSDIICDIKQCHGKDQGDVNLCYGHGQCNPANNAPNQCVCDMGYSGLECADYTCNGTLATSPNVCNSLGDCVGVDTCDCKIGVIGQFCEAPTCYGILGNTSEVCSNRNGECIDTNNCKCPDRPNEPGVSQYEGSQCETPYCFNVLATNNTVCSQRGNCTKFNKCICETNYEGVNCELTKCNGIFSNEPTVCGGHGTCVDHDVCECNSNYKKASPFACTIPLCEGLENGDPNVCHGRGTCTAGDMCTCTVDGWFGANCSIPGCFNRSASCSEHGDCNPTHNGCICDTGYTGDICEIWSCNNIPYTSDTVCNYKNGSCSSLNQCDCFSSNWTGANCELPSCFGVANQDALVCNGNGTCVSKDNCSCHTNVGYLNSACTNPGCFGKVNVGDVCSGHGECIGHDSCKCDYGYTGAECKIKTCFGVAASLKDTCSSHGSCVDIDTCVCAAFAGDVRYSGNNCQYQRCFSIDGARPESCSGHGVCISPDPNPICNCTNTDAWRGFACQLPVCYKIPKNNASACSGRGDCVAADECVCTDIYATGKQCEKWTCNGINHTDPNVCNGRGVCDKINECSCNSNWTGTFCDVPICFSLDATDMNVCQGHGNCTAPDVCQCDNVRVGNQCQYTNCGGGVSGPHLCHFQGTCIDNTTCNCNVHYYGSRCDRYVNACNETNVLSVSNNCTACNLDASTCLGYILPNFTISDTTLRGSFFVPNRKSTQIDCSKVFAPATLSQLGTNPVCKWASLTSHEFLVTFGEGAQATEETEFTFDLMPFDDDITLYSDPTKLKITGERTVEPPPPVDESDPYLWAYITSGVLSFLALSCCLGLCCLIFCTICIYRITHPKYEKTDKKKYSHDPNHDDLRLKKDHFKTAPGHVIEEDDFQLFDDDETAMVKGKTSSQTDDLLQGELPGEVNGELPGEVNSDVQPPNMTPSQLEAKYEWDDKLNKYVKVETPVPPSNNNDQFFKLTQHVMSAQKQADEADEGAVPFDFLVAFDPNISSMVSNRTRELGKRARERLAERRRLASTRANSTATPATPHNQVHPSTPTSFLEE